MIPGLLDADVNDEQSVIGLFDLNDQLHRQIQSELISLGLYGVSWPMATAYPPDEAWVDKHSNEHLMWSQLLSLDNPGGLSQYDLQDPAQFAQWVSIHARHHELIAQALNL